MQIRPAFGRRAAYSWVQIAARGAEGFYAGRVAEKLVAEMEAGGGLITREDLAGYRAEFRQPLRARYRDFDVFCPPPSAGGLALVELLNVLENLDLVSRGRWSSETLHLMVEAMRRVFLDRAAWLGDPINTVAQVVLNIIVFGMDPEQAVAAPRLHHQWLPDEIVVEAALAEQLPGELAALRRLGHRLAPPVPAQGDAHTIWIDPLTRQRVGIADARRNGSAVGY